MPELMPVYDRNRKYLYSTTTKEFRKKITEDYLNKGKKIDLQLKTVMLLLFNLNGELYIQRRSRSEDENAGLYDKTVGGHLTQEEKFDEYDKAIERECREELDFPVIVLSESDFNVVTGLDGVCKLLRYVAILKKLPVNEFMSFRKPSRGNNGYEQPFINTIYLGYYDGRFRIVPDHSSGIELFPYKELRDEIDEDKDLKRFTRDIDIISKTYGQSLKPIEKKSCTD